MTRRISLDRSGNCCACGGTVIDHFDHRNRFVSCANRQFQSPPPSPQQPQRTAHIVYRAGELHLLRFRKAA